jgi:hypothetical protein
MTTYEANVGGAEARWLADRERGPLSAAGFYGQGISGLITDLGDGRVLLDGKAMAALRGLPRDRDGHLSDDDGPALCIGNARHRLFPVPPATDPGGTSFASAPIAEGALGSPII